MKIFALLVGINRYKSIRGLNACESDVNSIKNYLTEAHGSDAVIETLIDDKATRDQIVKTFKTHLGKAKKGDVALFYFSGHGVRQQANEVFKKASMNDGIECITCHDTTLDGKNLLADKELRWLINDLYKATQSHVVAIFDSCHSGDATRGLEETQPVGSEPMKRIAVALAENPTEQARLPELVLPVRQWSDFIFAKNIKEEDVKKVVERGDSLDECFPQGNHVHLAAASSNEPAWEANGTGLFTKSLIEVLKTTNENITYYDFRSLAYQRLNRYYGGVRKNIRQSPQIYAYGESIFQPFFGGIVQQKGIEANLYYNAANKQWELDMGAIYGFPKPSESNPIQILAKIDDAGNQTESVYIKKVFSDYSVIEFEEAEKQRQAADGKDPSIAPPNFKKDKLNGYKCIIKKLLQKPLKVAFVGKNNAADWANFTAKNATLLDLASIIPEKDAKKADYLINTDGGIYFIALPTAPNRPLVEQVTEKDANKAFNEILKQFEAVSRWEFVKKHENKEGGADLLSKLEITVSDSKGTVYDLNNGKVDVKFNFDKYDEGYFSKEEIEIKIMNASPSTLYVAAAWLAERFGIDGTPINQNSLASPLNSGQTVNLWGSTTPFGFQPYMKDFDWDKFRNYLKIYVSDAPFNITLLQQLDLEVPKKLRSDSMKGAGARPTPVTQDTATKTSEWAVKTVEFVINV